MIGKPLGPLGYLASRAERAHINRTSRALYPGRLPLSRDRLRRLCPELFPSVRRPLSVARWLFGDSLAAVYELGDILVHGGSGPALVADTGPLLVGCYSQNIDCVALLRFPDWLTAEHALRPGDQLLTVLNVLLTGRLAPDLTHGPESWHFGDNFQPFVADFLTDDRAELAARKAGIAEPWWDRAGRLTDEYLRREGRRARDGRPTRAWRPAPPVRRPGP